MEFDVSFDSQISNWTVVSFNCNKKRGSSETRDMGLSSKHIVNEKQQTNQPRIVCPGTGTTSVSFAKAINYTVLPWNQIH